MFGVFVQLNEDSKKAKCNPIGYVVAENGCWDWVGGTNGAGYGVLRPKSDGGRRWYAHRWVYTQARGPITEGLVLDHRCRRPGCVNPDHLEVVTQQENCLRGESPSAKFHRVGMCAKGHSVRGKNLLRLSNGKRVCRKCRRALEKAASEKKRIHRRVVCISCVEGEPDFHKRVRYDLECGHQVFRRPHASLPPFRNLLCPACGPTPIGKSP